MTSSSEWQRLANAVNDRVVELGIDQAELVRRSGLSQPTIRSIMDGDPRGLPRPKSLRKLAVGLGWSAGSVEIVMAGGAPIVEDHQPFHQPPSLAIVSDSDLNERLDRIDERQKVLLDQLREQGQRVQDLYERLIERGRDEQPVRRGGGARDGADGGAGTDRDD